MQQLNDTWIEMGGSVKICLRKRFAQDVFADYTTGIVEHGTTHLSTVDRLSL